VSVCVCVLGADMGVRIGMCAGCMAVRIDVCEEGVLCVGMMAGDVYEDRVGGDGDGVTENGGVEVEGVDDDNVGMAGRACAALTRGICTCEGLFVFVFVCCDVVVVCVCV